MQEQTPNNRVMLLIAWGVHGEFHSRILICKARSMARGFDCGAREETVNLRCEKLVRRNCGLEESDTMLQRGWRSACVESRAEDGPRSTGEKLEPLGWREAENDGGRHTECACYKGAAVTVCVALSGRISRSRNPYGVRTRDECTKRNRWRVVGMSSDRSTSRQTVTPTRAVRCQLLSWRPLSSQIFASVAGTTKSSVRRRCLSR